MKQTLTLNCKFKDSEEKSRSILITNPTDDLTEDKIKDFMNYVIESEVLLIDENNPDLKYVSILGANLTMTKVEEITLS